MDKIKQALVLIASVVEENKRLLLPLDDINTLESEIRHIIDFKDDAEDLTIKIECKNCVGFNMCGDPASNKNGDCNDYKPSTKKDIIKSGISIALSDWANSGQLLSELDKTLMNIIDNNF